MNSWLVWAAFLLVALVLTLVGYHFSLRALRWVAVSIALVSTVYITWYGLTHPARVAGSLSAAFARGADALSVAIFHPLPVPPGHIPGPGRIGWIVIVVLLVIGYRLLEVWALHWQAPSLDSSALADDKQDDADAPATDKQSHETDKQRHDRLAAELKFRLAAVEVRSPAILPGGSRSSALASIAEASGVTGSGLAGAVINFFGMLWPGPRRIRVRVWAEHDPGHPGIDDVTRVTVDLENARTGATIAIKTLAARNLDEAASVAAGFVARHIFIADRTAPPWCTGAVDGRDLAAMLLARQVRVYPESKDRVLEARPKRIRYLEGAARSHLCAGVVRYELAQLYDSEGKHTEALLLHAINREQNPRFFRGRYRLAMSLEMIANSESEEQFDAAALGRVHEAMTILRRHHKPGDAGRDARQPGKSQARHWGELRRELLDIAWEELQDIRRYLTLRHIAWRSLWHRDERAILKPYWRLRHRQPFRDGVCVALLLVAVREVLKVGGQSGRKLPHARTLARITTTIAGDTSALARVVPLPPRPAGWLTSRAVKLLDVLRKPRPRRDRSWQAAYNLACTYAAIAQREPPAGNRHERVGQVVTSLRWVVEDPNCEIERPSEWIPHDPDFRGLADDRTFRAFLEDQERCDYPDSSEQDAVTHPETALSGRPG
jgi:hypothetical protein